MALHDGLGQELTGLSISLESLVRKAEAAGNPLRSLTTSARCLYGVRMRCSVRGLGDQDLPSNTAHQLYRISQEAISNAIRHGQATQIDLRVIRDGGRLQLLVRDNGRGISDKPPGDGIGLHTMRYRAKMIGAELDVGPSSGGGARVRCSLCLGGVAGAASDVR